MRGVCAAFLLCAAFPLFSQDWYLSNPSGMALEKQASQMIALHAEWSLSVEKKAERDLPKIIIPYYSSVFGIECRTLYQRGIAVREQWLFRDERGITRLNASLLPEHSLPEASEDEGPPGRLPFIELYSEEHRITEFHQINSAGERYITRYFYRDQMLLNAETRFKGSVAWRDEYKYTRTAKLRGVTRTFSGASAQRPVSFRFPVSEPFISPDSPYDAAFMTGALKDVFDVQSKIMYNTDDLGKVLSEQHLDEEGNVIAEIINDWNGNQLVSVRWKTEDAVGNTEFEYSSSGDRVSEKNYRNGVLERTVTRSGIQDIEELYMGGRVILRAVWENGRKISEERL